MGTSTGRLSLASDMQSTTGWMEGAASKTLEGPAAALAGGGSGAGNTGARDLPTPHRFQANEGVDMTKRTRGPSSSDSETRYSAVKITPASSDSATVPSTHTSA